MKYKISKFGDNGLHICIKKSDGFSENDEVYIVKDQNYIALSSNIQERLKQFAYEGDTPEDTIRRLIDIYEIDRDSRK